MNKKRVISLVVAVVGIVLFAFGSYIASEVREGQQKISSAQKNVDQGRSLSGKSSYTKGIGGFAADSVQKKIDEGKDEAAMYQTIANWLHGLGVVFFVAGGCVFGLTYRKNS